MSVKPAPAPERPYRSVPVRIFNAAGRLLRRCGWRRPLCADRILARACRRTGLSDFGNLDIREPLERLVESLETENRLTPLGRVLIYHKLAQLAEARLGVQAALRQHPEILQEQVARPIFILGLPRTGTTLLHRLLAQDPDSRALCAWETSRPAPGPNRHKDWQVRLMRFEIALTSRYLAPRLRSIHPSAAEEPEECRLLLMNTFRTALFGEYGHITAFARWLYALGEENTEAVYEEYHRQLQLLQWRCPPRHWVLKCPQHASALDVLLRRFPGACIVQNHRDLAEALPSSISMRVTTMRIYSDDVDPCLVAARGCQHVVDRVLRPALRARAAHPGRVFDVFYRDLLRDPIATVHSIYEHFGLRVGAAMEQNMQQWLAANPQGKHGRHRYSLEQFGLDRAAIDRLFPDYPACFGLPPQPCTC